MRYQLVNTTSVMIIRASWWTHATICPITFNILSFFRINIQVRKITTIMHGVYNRIINSANEQRGDRLKIDLATVKMTVGQFQDLLPQS